MTQPLKTFIIYSRKDESFKNELMAHLRSSLVSTGYLEVWQDGDILPGEDWEKKIEEKLEASDIFLVLLSVDSLDSEFIQKRELAKALEKKSRIVPVLVRKCFWKNHPIFKGLQGLPKNMEPVTSFAHHDDAWTKVVEELHDMVERIRATENAERERAERERAEKENAERERAERESAEKEKVHREKVQRKIAEKHRQALISSLNQPGLPEMVFVAGGHFLMGDEHGDLSKDCRPVHAVTLSDFFIGKYPVTQKEWQAVMGNNPSHFKGEALPVENVSWADCQNFLIKLAQSTGLNYRLPTEAEWEYAARGGQLSKQTRYAGSDDLDEVGWYDGNSGSSTHPVGQKKPNELRLYDMSGNVWEWCSDWDGDYKDKGQSDLNPTGSKTGWYRVARGGGWNSVPQVCRPAYRRGWYPDGRYFNLGLRLVFAL